MALILYNPPDIDQETALLIAQLSLDDLVEIETSRKGKSREDVPPTDEERAFDIQRQLLEEFLRFDQDRRLAQSLENALDVDQDILTVLGDVERAAEDDRRAAEAVSRGLPMPPKTVAQRSVEDLDEQALEPSGDSSLELALVPVKPAGVTGVVASSSNTQIALQADDDTPAPTPKGHPRIECTICGDRLRQPAAEFTAPCGHYQCRECLIDLVESCIRDESLYPLRCCQQHIPLDTVFPRLKPFLRSRFRLKTTEYNTPAIERVYCPKPTCSSFVGSSTSTSTSRNSSASSSTATLNSLLVCHTCNTSICSLCKSEAHGSTPCPENSAIQALKDLAVSEHWQTCPSCKNIVELAHGCNHMTCRCGAHFCYVCAAKWKTCQCPQWDEVRLYDVAQRRVQADEGGRGAGGLGPQPGFMARVREQAERLRVNHDCDPHRWAYRHGGGTCEECYYYGPIFLMRCRGCQLMVCKRCSRNRL